MQLRLAQVSCEKQLSGRIVAPMEAPRSLNDDHCTVAATLAIVGERWTLRILRAAFYGLKRYADLLEATGCARNILSDRLKRMVDAQLLQPQAYREPGQRERAEYRLTPRALELFPVLVALKQWGDRWLTRDGQPPVRLLHRDCGSDVLAELRCSAGHGPLTARETEAAAGSGRLKRRPAAQSTLSSKARSATPRS